MSLTHGSKPSNTEPRKKSRQSKAERRLATRIAGYESSKGGKTQMHKPGSQNVRNK